MLRLILAVVLIGAAFAGPVTYTHLSPRGSGTLQSLEIDGCDTSKCNFVKGKDAIMRITYTTATTANVHSVHTGKVSGVVLGISVPFPLPEANFCKLDVGTQCPVSPGATNSVVVSVYVDPVYPSLTVPVRFEILDDKNARIVGVQFTVSLVNQSG